MTWKFVVLALLVLGWLYRLLLNVAKNRSAKNPTPSNVADIFDAETYTRWRAYCAAKCRLQIVSDAVSLVLTAVLLLCNAFSAVASLFPGTVYSELIAVLIFYTLTETLFGAVFSYFDTMVIEQRYGFNRTTMKTFVLDQIRSFIISVLLSISMMCALALIYINMGDWVILLLAGMIFLFSLVCSFLYPFFSRVGNKFVPLADGELRERLTSLLEKHNYKVKAIEVMDASRRTTKLNAYFTGFGKMKTIVLYDNLVNALSVDEICAVFAHELGHGLHKDVLKQQTMNLGNLLLMSLLVWLTVKLPEMHVAFGFTMVNYGFSMILLDIILGITQPLTGMATNAYSRYAEYRADRQAVKEGYGAALIVGLKMIAKENFAHLSPSPMMVVLEYSHPPLSARIAALDKALENN